MFAFTRDRDDALVIGAGVPSLWVDEAPGVRVRRLPTPYGALDFSMLAAGDSLVVQVEEGIWIPLGGIVIQAPTRGEISRVTINGATVAPGSDGEIAVKTLPSTVVIRH